MKGSRRGGAGRFVGLALVVVVAGAAVVGAAFYQEQIAGYFSQQGWNPGAAEAAVREFIRDARDPKGGDAAVKLLKENEYQPQVQNGRLVELRKGGGMLRIPASRFAPKADVKQMTALLRVKGEARHRVQVQFANGKWGEYTVVLLNGARRISTVPERLSDQAPAPPADDY